jgi:hypothetical protein
LLWYPSYGAVSMPQGDCFTSDYFCSMFVDTVLSVKGKQAKNQFPPLKQR